MAEQTRPRPRVGLLLALLCAAVLVTLLALQLGRPGDGSEGFAGTDATATELIAQDHPQYRPWFEPVLTLPGGEIESGLFALQAAAGAGALGFILGTWRERARQRRLSATSPPPPDAPR